MDFSLLNQFEQLNQSEKLALGLIVVLCGVGLIVFYRWFSSDSYLKKVNRMVKKISSDYFKDISLDLGEEQYAYFDYLLLSRQGIIALEIKNFSGHIYGSAGINEWTQIIERKSYKFSNPFFELEKKIDLLKELVPDQDINGIILFTEKADFPKGRPDNVMRVSECLRLFGKTSKGDTPESYTSGWNNIKAYLSQACSDEFA